MSFVDSLGQQGKMRQGIQVEGWLSRVPQRWRILLQF
jgi:hypothetical protein